MRRTVNIIIKGTIHIFASIGKIVRILLMGRRNRERWRLMLKMVYKEINRVVYTSDVAGRHNEVPPEMASECTHFIAQACDIAPNPITKPPEGRFHQGNFLQQFLYRDDVASSVNSRAWHI